MSAVGSSKASSSALVNAPCCSSGVSYDTSAPVDEVSTVTFAAARAVRSAVESIASGAAVRRRRAGMAGVEQHQHAAVLGKLGQLCSQLIDRQSVRLDASVVARIDLVGQQIQLAVNERAVAGEVHHREVVAAAALHVRRELV